MKLSDVFRFSTDNLRRRKGRTVLTVIGVVVGVCAIVVMISLGIAVNQATDAMLRGYGDLTKLTVYRYGAQQGTPALDDDMVAQFSQIPHVLATTPIYQSQNVWGNLYAGKNDKYASYASVVGMEPNAIQPMGFELVAGTGLEAGGTGKKKIPVLVENETVFNFYIDKMSWNNPNRQKYPQYDDMGNVTNPPVYDENGVLQNPDDYLFDIMSSTLVYRIVYEYDDMGNPSKYLEYELVPVGMIKAANNDWQVRGGVVMSIEDMKRIEDEYNRVTKSGKNQMGGMAYMFYGDSGDGTTTVEGYDNVYVKVDDVKNMPDVEKAIRDIGYRFDSMSQLREELQGNVAQTQMMLGGLAAVSLFVAALNIANTMTMAIYERTKEIGVMKVLGCKLSNIRQMFLIESGAIGFLGGVIGVALSWLLSLLLNYLSVILAWLQLDSSIDLLAIFGLSGMSQMVPDAKLSVIPLWLVLLALVFSTVVGLLSGIAPANRAVKISSLEAIRHE